MEMFLAPKISFCFVNDNNGVNSDKRSFKGYSEEHRMVKLNNFKSLLERKQCLIDSLLIGLKRLRE